MLYQKYQVLVLTGIEKKIRTFSSCKKLLKDQVTTLPVGGFYRYSIWWRTYMRYEAKSIHMLTKSAVG